MFRFSEWIDAFAWADGPPPDTLVPFFKWSLKGSWRVILFALVVSLCVGVTEIFSAFFIGWSIDYAIAQGAVEGAENIFTTGAVIFLGLAIFFIVLRPALQGLNAALSALVIQANLYPLVLARLNRHTIGQSLTYFDDDFAGRIAQKEQQTARALMDVVMETINIIGMGLSGIFGAMILLGSIDGKLATILLLWFISYCLLIAWFLPRIRKRAKARANARAVVTGQLVDTITNISTVKLFAHGNFEDQAALKALGGYRDTAIDFGTLTAQFRVVLMTLAGILPVALIGGALWFWSRGTATPGDIAAAGLVASRLGHMSGWMSFTALGVFSNIGEIEDGMRTLSPSHEIVDAADAITPGQVKGRVAYENVTFTYGKEKAALREFNLEIAPGEKVALVGSSGAGKSTAASLLMRLYEVESGRITLDGHDIRSLTQDGLRGQISMVTQETAMFNRSARENIRYGTPEATDEQVEAAATRAAAQDFIPDLRDLKGREGYEAHLGERGVKLSGGQRQRIALARAILKDAPVLILDEATSALDSEVEALIQAALQDVMQGKTVIAIAHRLSTIESMDRIIVLDQGRIIEEGTHQELLARSGQYSKFWSRQAGGFSRSAAV